MRIAYLIIGFVASFMASAAIASSWTKTNDSRIKEMIVNKKLVALSFDVPHVSQPDQNTCGATNIQMALGWLFFSGEDIRKIYDQVNTNGEAGVQMPEMLSGLSAQVSRKNGKTGKTKVNPSEEEFKDVKEALKGMMNHMNSKKRPVIIVGNTDRGIWTREGGHYYTPTRVYYDDVSKTKKFGIELNDSVYKSPAGFDITGISPTTFLSDKELATYWKPTGNKFPWLRKVRYVSY